MIERLSIGLQDILSLFLFVEKGEILWILGLDL